jgi:hypothetical protein
MLTIYQSRLANTDARSGECRNGPMKSAQRSVASLIFRMQRRPERDGLNPRCASKQQRTAGVSQMPRTSIPLKRPFSQSSGHSRDFHFFIEVCAGMA